MGVTYLLDTHVVLWLLGEPARVDRGVRGQLDDPSARLLVSAVSAMEVATKSRLGKLDIGRVLTPAWERHVRELGTEMLDVTTDHALLAGSMTWDHRDPFDRLLVAQALIENVTLVTTDRAMREVVGLRVLAW